MVAWGTLAWTASTSRCQYWLNESYRHCTKRRISGSVEVEFKTTPTGEIYEIKVRTSSGHAELDNAALQNMHRGRWTGEAGYFVKNFVFVLN